MIRTPAVAVLPSVAAGPGSDFALSAFRQAPVDYRIDATDRRLAFNGELGLTDQSYGGSGIAIGSRGCGHSQSTRRSPMTDHQSHRPP
jgi:hypothetical protein